MAALGVAAKLFFGPRMPTLSTVVYLVLGWLVVVAIVPLFERVGWGGLAWLLAGGLAYTAGVVFYVSERFRFGHLVWHVFVIGGSVCHTIAVSVYSIGRAG
jgi:hemolysin III